MNNNNLDETNVTGIGSNYPRDPNKYPRPYNSLMDLFK